MFLKNRIFRIILSAFSVFLLLFSVSCKKNDTLKYSGDNFSFIKPEQWSAVENVANTLVYYEKQVYSLTEGFNPVISISGGDNEKNVPDDYLESIVKILSDAVLQFNVVYSGDYNKKPAKRLIYTGLMGETAIKWDMVFFVKKNKSYIVTYTCLPGDYEEYLPDFYKVADSFRLK
ncbi:MAG: hypothetical protein JW982_10600 [Spirochaetes bacterium]|nr:hypothetical protein [Spirochaetota bacterium]